MILFPIVGFIALLVAVLALMAISFTVNSLLRMRQPYPTPQARNWGYAGGTTLRVLGVFATLAVYSTWASRSEMQACEMKALGLDPRLSANIPEIGIPGQMSRQAIRSIVAISDAALLAADADETTAVQDNSAKVVAVPAVAGPAVVDDGRDAKVSVETAAATTEAQDASGKEVKKPKPESATDIVQWIRSLIDAQDGHEPAQPSEVGQAAQSLDGDVVVLQLSDEGAEQLLGESAHAMLKSMNAELPSRLRQTYALISLTPSVDAGVTPVNPVLAAGGLKAIANSIEAIIARSGKPQAASSEPASSKASITLLDVGGDSPFPQWLKNPDGGRIVVETEFAPVGEDTKGPLALAVNKAWGEHLAKFASSLEPSMQKQARFVKLELDPETAQSCVLQTYERVEGVQTAIEGQKSMRKVYALVEFPESIDKIAVQRMRFSAQQDRAASLGALVVVLWLVVASAGCGIRLRRHSSRLVRFSSLAVFGGLTLPVALLAVGFTISLATGDIPQRPWIENTALVKIHVD